MVLCQDSTSVLCACKIPLLVSDLVSASPETQHNASKTNKPKADYNSAFPAGVTVAATWDREQMYIRGNDMGMEHRGKGVDVQLGPVVGPLGRSPEGGRNWEGLSFSAIFVPLNLINPLLQASAPTPSSVVSLWRRPSRVSKMLVSLHAPSTSSSTSRNISVTLVLNLAATSPSL